ncbi:hypothetical protein SAMN05216410_1718 [Sanguibacter gelidistatuariae]|uniref:Plant heme peroxidase family profile domain-containing protein n=1 Tax=Sanguibacter gelidistatuariae TaxID=1814289 RepID=A0A1G6KYM2_9MICO|nr:hypothetical protein [Sanguibacter gelidistatuariae]SDC36023.1 hypothetical protein SAMN05216410_1718 [Sanguibacter gelidistatuariae]
MAAGVARSLVLGSALGLCVAALAGCSTPGTPDTAVSPGDEFESYMDAIFAGFDYTASLSLEQDAIAACMGDLGFEYIPTFARAAAISLDFGDPAENAEFRRVEGWGVTAEQSGTGMAGPGSSTRLTPVVDVDPNEVIVDAMSASTKDAYDLALYGIDRATGELVSTTSCSQVARETYSIEGALAPTPDLAAVYEEMREVRSNYGSDPRILDLDARWAQCMTDAGYLGYTTPFNASSRFEEIVANPLSPLTPDEFETQRALEVATAVTDEQCREALDYDQVTLDIRSARNIEFVTENQDALDAMVIAAQENTPRLPEKTETP